MWRATSDVRVYDFDIQHKYGGNGLQIWIAPTQERRLWRSICDKWELNTWLPECDKILVNTVDLFATNMTYEIRGIRDKR